MDSVIVIARGPYCQTPAPESDDMVTLPAPLGFVKRCHHRRGRQPLTARVPASMCLDSGITHRGLHPCTCLLEPQASQAFPTSLIPSCSWLGRQVLLLFSIRREHVFSWRIPSWPGFVSLAASEGCGGAHSNRQHPAPTWTNRAREVAAGTGGHLAGGQGLRLEASVDD